MLLLCSRFVASGDEEEEEEEQEEVSRSVWHGHTRKGFDGVDVLCRYGSAMNGMFFIFQAKTTAQEGQKAAAKNTSSY